MSQFWLYGWIHCQFVLCLYFGSSIWQTQPGWMIILYYWDPSVMPQIIAKNDSLIQMWRNSDDYSQICVGELVIRKIVISLRGIFYFLKKSKHHRTGNTLEQTPLCTFILHKRLNKPSLLFSVIWPWKFRYQSTTFKPASAELQHLPTVYFWRFFTASLIHIISTLMITDKIEI